jgi:hypothetical protein
MERNTSDTRGRTGGWARIAISSASTAAVMFFAVGCGGHHDEQAASGTSQSLLVASSATPAASVQGTSPAQVSGAGEGTAALSADSLPPDVSVTVADTLVDAGGSVELTAQGSPDVVGVTLSDGLGSKQPFAYDAATDTWKVYYRVPVRARVDRLALSVTATNAPQRWRRVWLFLTVRREAPAAAVPDSSTKP